MSGAVLAGEEVGKQTSAHVLVAMLDVEEDLVSDTRTLGRLHRLRTEECSESEEKQAKRSPGEEHGGEGEREDGCQRLTVASADVAHARSTTHHTLMITLL